LFLKSTYRKIGAFFLLKTEPRIIYLIKGFFLFKNSGNKMKSKENRK